MRPSFAFLLFSLLIPTLPAAGAPREETLFLFENRKVVVGLPEGFNLERGRETAGVFTIGIADASGRVSGEIRFLPDAELRFLQSRPRKELMNEMFNEYVAASTEQAMQFEELEPRTGAGTYCVFTDARLVGKSPLPAGEYLHLTVGLKAWPGVVAIFRVFSQDTQSREYKAVLTLLRESLEERAVPLK
ncbi:MAG: hypothetical protein JNL92_20680 [Opitutaceae bacterium]|nr:hypothetical protein [Opitutaceae bacterium]